MNRIKSISSATILVTIALVMTMDLCCELPKFPYLIAHFSQHQEEDNDSFLQFLMEDYIHHESDHNHHEDEDHDDLPFHGSHACHHAPVAFTDNLNYSLLSFTLYMERGNGEYRFSFSSIYLEAPFQPPQYA